MKHLKVWPDVALAGNDFLFLNEKWLYLFVAVEYDGNFILVKDFCLSIEKVLQIFQYLSSGEFIAHASFFVRLHILHYVLPKLSQESVFEFLALWNIMSGSSLIVIFSNKINDTWGYRFHLWVYICFFVGD